MHEAAKRRPMKQCYWVEPGKLLAGEYPRTLHAEESDAKILGLLEAGVTCFVDLSHPKDRLQPYAQIIERLAHPAVAVRHFPIRDFSVPESAAQTAEILDAIDAEIDQGGMAYVHCWGGVGRTGVIAGCWLARHHDDGREALARLQELWRACPKSANRQSPETPEQAEYIVNWSESPGGRTRSGTLSHHRRRRKAPPMQSRFRGTILGLAIGDAIGAPVEFLSRDGILARYGPAGITGLDGWGGFPAGFYTDDTQMSLATAVGMIRARHHWKQRGEHGLPAVVHRRYLAWRQTQQDPHQIRAPGNTCLSALDSGRMGTIQEPLNNSKGCGGVMRTAPVGLALLVGDAFQTGAECAAITHGHPSGYLSAGYLSELIRRLVQGHGLKSAVLGARHVLMRYPQHEETLRSIDQALALAKSPTPAHEAIAQLGEGWVGEEALGISLFCALRHPNDWSAGTLAAVDHSGDSDSTGSICGAILGAALGAEAIPAKWIDQIENRHLLEQTATDLYAAHVEDKTLSFEEYPPE